MTSGPRYREDFLTINAPSTTSLEPRISSLEETVTSVKADANSHETQYQALTLKVNTAEGSISNLSGQVSNSVTLCNQNKTELSGLNASLAGVQTTLSQAATSHSQQIALLQDQISGLGGAASSLSDIEDDINRVDGRATAISNNAGLTRTALAQLIESVIGPDAEWPVGSGAFTVPLGKTSIIDSLIERIDLLTQRIVALETAPPAEPEAEWEWSLDAKRGGEHIDYDMGDNEVTKWQSVTSAGGIESSWSPFGTPYLNNPPGYIHLNAYNNGFQTEMPSVFGKTIYAVMRLTTTSSLTLFDMGADLRFRIDHHIDPPNVRTIPVLTYKGGDGVTHQVPDSGGYANFTTYDGISNSVSVFKASVAADRIAVGIANADNTYVKSKVVATNANAAGIFRFAPEFKGNVYELVLFDGIHDDSKATEVMSALVTKHNH